MLDVMTQAAIAALQTEVNRAKEIFASLSPDDVGSGQWL